MVPAAIGIGDSDRRHVPGLRREEVAGRAGISTTWYTWLEQGRDINVSDDVLDKIGDALALGTHERAYMKLMMSDTPAHAYDMRPQIPEVLRVLVESHKAAPAYITTPRFDLLVWNDFLGRLFHYSDEDNALSRNILWRLFFDPSRRNLYLDWEDAARRTVAAFRWTRAQYLGDAHFENLLGRLLKNKDFARMWRLHEVAMPGLPPFMIRHDTLGLCELTTVQATLGIAPGYYLALFSARQLS